MKVLKPFLGFKQTLLLLLLLILPAILSSCTPLDEILFGSRYKIEDQPVDACLNTSSTAETGNECQICHSEFSKNHHPVDFLPPDIDLIKIDQQRFPLFDGKIQCFTCHTTDKKDTPGNRKLLRGGPYSNIRKLCFQCHYQEKYAQIDIHKMHNESGGLRIINGKLVCTFCHPQNINNLYSTNTVQFKAEVPFLCLRCHQEMNDPHIRPHFLITPSEKVKVQIKDFEKQNKIILPLVPRGKISCATCHNPHQKGALVSESAMAGADSPFRLRIEKDKLCRGCHLIW